MKKTTVLFMLLAVLTIATFTGCGDLFKFNESSVSEHVQNLDPIISGEYTVLDTRESISGNNVRVKYHVTMILQDINGNRFYYEYRSNDDKNKEYLHLAKFVTNDKVSYKDGYFTLLQEE